MLRHASIVLFALVSGCSSSASSGNGVAESPAGLKLAISVDATVDIDALSIQADDGSTTPFFETYEVPADAKLPGTLWLVPSTGNGPSSGTLQPGSVPIVQSGAAFTLHVVGSKSGTTLVQRDVELTMPSDLRELDINLDALCALMACPSAGVTCKMGVCGDDHVDVSTLPVATD